MLSLRHLFLFVLLLVLVKGQSFDGTWEDFKYGGLMYLCEEDDGEVQGSYSEAGLLHLQRNGDRIIGFWVEGGGYAVDCTYGDIQMEISDDEDVIRGSWNCNEDITRSTQFTISKIASVTPNVTQCVKIAKSGTIAGQWLIEGGGERLDICPERDLTEYHMSYAYYDDESNLIQGCEEGYLAESQIASGFYNEGAGVRGVSLVFLMEGGILGNYYWQDNTFSGVDYMDVNDTLKHEYNLYDLDGAIPYDDREEICFRNRGLCDDIPTQPDETPGTDPDIEDDNSSDDDGDDDNSDDDDNPDDDYDPYDDDSSSSTIILSFIMMFFFVSLIISC